MISENENLPVVTIYITNFNYEKFIKKSIDSVLNQSFQDFELFIIDDGSTDNSRSIIEEYSKISRIKIIYQKNKGLNITNNVALRASKGKYIMRLDADDFLELNAIQVMVSKLEDDSNLGLVFPDYYLVDEYDVKIGEVVRLNFEAEVSLFDQPAHGACTMIRKECLINLGGYNESYSCQDGYELWIKFISHYRVNNINIPLFSYRQHGKNLTSNEDRILGTRSLIKKDYISYKKLKIPNTIAVIPIRDVNLEGINIALIKIGGVTLLERLLTALKNSSHVKKIIITSESNEIEAYYNENYLQDCEISFLERPEIYARINESLNKTLLHVLAQDFVIEQNFDAILTVSINYPNISSNSIDDAINSLVIFEADSLLSVRPDNSTYFQHHGTGLKAILDQDKFTKLERENLYKGVGGIVVSLIAGFKNENKMLNGRIGHIVVSKKEAILIEDINDVKVFNALN